MGEELTGRLLAAAFHGSALNQAYPIQDRLQMALQALHILESELEAMDARLAAYEPGSDQ